MTLRVEHPQKTLWTWLFVLIFGEHCIRSMRMSRSMIIVMLGGSVLAARVALPCLSPIVCHGS